MAHVDNSLRPLCPYFPPAPLSYLSSPLSTPTNPSFVLPLYPSNPYDTPLLPLIPHLSLFPISKPLPLPFPSISPNLNPSNPTFPAASTLYSLSLSPINSLPSPPFSPLLYSPPIYPYPSILTFLPLNPSPYSSLPLLLPYT